MSEHELEQLSELIHIESMLTRKAIHELTTVVNDLIKVLRPEGLVAGIGEDYDNLSEETAQEAESLISEEISDGNLQTQDGD